MDTVYWEILEQIIVIAIGVILPPVLALLTVYANRITNALVARIEGEIGAKNFELLRSMAEEAVRAAEQMGLSDKIENVGEEKKRFALRYLQDRLDASGIKIDINELDAAIEAAVQKAFNDN
jgi:LL-H family phage holin